MKHFTLLILLFLSVPIFAQDYYIINAKNGLNVRSGSDLSANKTGKIRYGALVEKIADTDRNLTITDGGKKITGKFIKIKYNNYYFNSEAIEGYVFDGFLTKQVDNTLISITKIEKETYHKYSKLVMGEYEKLQKISNLDSIKTMLNGRVEWLYETSVKSIILANGEKLVFNPNVVDFGFSEGYSGYYPEEEILFLEGGHSSDICFSIKTGESDLTIGNPEYIIASPQNTYRLNGSFGGQECISYFFKKKKKEHLYT